MQIYRYFKFTDFIICKFARKFIFTAFRYTHDGDDDVDDDDDQVCVVCPTFEQSFVVSSGLLRQLLPPPGEHCNISFFHHFGENVFPFEHQNIEICLITTW